mmetsp:Transcript_33436/g.77255  ORF Transcript_33436/g.77255 Transcript_33436/m.77255 type:complete len:262 (+) Transcript_33436:91-876(+)
MTSLLRTTTRHLRPATNDVLLLKCGGPTRHLSAVGDHTRDKAHAEEALTPRAQVAEALARLESFSERLCKMRNVVRTGVFKEVVMSCRDADVDTFHHVKMKNARANLLPLATELEREMADMAKEFSTGLAPKMHEAGQVCQTTPCGGVSWLVADGEVDVSVEGNVHLDGKNTPCGQLAAANSDFIGLTLETRPDAELASRAASFLRMAKKHEMPLIALRESEEGRRAISETMTREKVPTPWLRTEAEYERYLAMRTQPELG